MKKNIIYGMILLAAVACNKENMGNNLVPQPGEGETAVRLTGEIALPATKVEFDDTYGQFTWSSANDKIAVHVTEGKRGDKVMVPASYTTASVVPNDPASTCDFFFVLSEGQTRDYYAVYPADIADAGNYGNPDLKVILPSEYEIGPQGMENWSPTPMVAVNDPSSQTLTFRHIGGLLRLMLNDVSPATASFEVSLGKRITGSFTVNDPATSVPYIATDDNADVVTFTLSEPPSEYTDGFILNLPVPTGLYEMLSVKAKNENGDVIFSYNDEDVRSFFSGRGRHCETVVSTVSIPLCFEAQEDGAITIDNPKALTIEFSFDNKNWTAESDDRIYIPFDEGDCIYFRGNNEKYSNVELPDPDDLNSSFSPVAGTKFGCDGKCYVYGNIMSLIDADHFPDRTDFTETGALAFLFAGATDIVLHPEKGLELSATTLTPACYAFMFQNCSGLVSAPSLPARTVAAGAYIMMFDACTSLATAPELPATELGEASYEFMFEGCTSLTKTPELPATIVPKEAYAGMFLLCTGLEEFSPILATEVGESCCMWMFNQCTSLTKIPVLPATTLGKDCYSGMFYKCSGLETIPTNMLPATTLAEDCYNQMFYKCTSLTNAPDLPATTIAKGCYKDMFQGCTSLREGPEVLPASSLVEDCYNGMFYQCSSLTKAPELPATTLAKNCYYNMFYGCSGLTVAPAILPATTLPEKCYYRMFYNCTSLTTAPVLVDAVTAGTYCYDEMFYGCTNLNYVKAMFLTFPSDAWSWLSGVSSEGTFVMNAAATWDPASHRGDSGIPNGWTVETATE